jgi:hypothetical protein
MKHSSDCGISVQLYMYGTYIGDCSMTICFQICTVYCTHYNNLYLYAEIIMASFQTELRNRQFWCVQLNDCIS